MFKKKQEPKLFCEELSFMIINYNMYIGGLHKVMYK